ncbi:MAG: type II secretion system protein N [Arenicellales bacterium]
MPVSHLTIILKKNTSLLIIYTIVFALLTYSIFDIYQRIRKFNNIESRVDMAKQPELNADRDALVAKDTKQISSFFLFGRKNSNTPAIPVAEAPATRLKLTLHGVIAGNDPVTSAAIISIDGKKSLLFSTGDHLPMGNAVINEIYPEKILLMRNGKLESLNIDRPELESKIEDKIIKKAFNNDDRLLMLPMPEEDTEKSAATDDSH